MNAGWDGAKWPYSVKVRIDFKYFVDVATLECSPGESGTINRPLGKNAEDGLRMLLCTRFKQHVSGAFLWTSLTFCYTSRSIDTICQMNATSRYVIFVASSYRAIRHHF